MEKKLNRFNKLYIWYAGMSGDLLFWIAIDTLFLTVVKHFTVVQISTLTTISLIFCILLQWPCLGIIKRIGNTKSVRVGAFFLVLGSILLGFSSNFYILLLGEIFYEIAFVFQDMVFVVLEDNLELQNRGDEYIKFRSNENIVYGILTMIISLAAGYLFNLNPYLPMFGGVAICLLCFVLSFYMVDYSEHDRIIRKPVQKNNGRVKRIPYPPYFITHHHILCFVLSQSGLCANQRKTVYSAGITE